MAETKDQANDNGGESPAPGAVIAPGGAAPPSEKPAPTTTPKPEKPAEAPQPAKAESEPEPEEPLSQPADDNDSITWTASEFVHHDKSPGWYLALAGGAVVAAGLVYLVVRDFVSVAVVLVAAVLLGVYGSHQPRQLKYNLDGHGVSIGDKYHPYDDFKSFSVIPEGAFSSIVFLPLKRFAVVTTIYYAPEDEDKIIDMLASRLPYEEPRQDAVDKLMRRIRF